MSATTANILEEPEKANDKGGDGEGSEEGEEGDGNDSKKTN